MENSTDNDVSFKQLLLKATSFCAYQERSTKEVLTKLYELETPTDWISLVIQYLLDENYLNEERFAFTYAGGKFRVKKWGKLKIIQGLKLKGIQTQLIQKAIFNAIDEEDYRSTLQLLLEKKNKEIKDVNVIVRKGKLLRFVQSKGYESELAIAFIDKMKLKSKL